MSRADNQPVRASRLSPPTLWREAANRERTLTFFALFMALALVPTLIAMGLDGRELRGVNIWAKPAKFMASLSLFAISTAWFVGLLPPAQRRSRSVRLVVWTIVVAGAAEVGYISLQAAQEEGTQNLVQFGGDCRGVALAEELVEFVGAVELIGE